MVLALALLVCKSVLHREDSCEAELVCICALGALKWRQVNSPWTWWQDAIALRKRWWHKDVVLRQARTDSVHFSGYLNLRWQRGEREGYMNEKGSNKNNNGNYKDNLNLFNIAHIRNDLHWVCHMKIHEKNNDMLKLKRWKMKKKKH